MSETHAFVDAKGAKWLSTTPGGCGHIFVASDGFRSGCGMPADDPIHVHYSDDHVTLHHGDARDVLALLPTASVDSICTDPPYELGFMGKAWDGSGVAYDAAMWAQALRVLKPGGHLLAFGGTRTYHRMTVAIEDAGFEIRDSIHWIYGSGFPKSLDVSKAIDKAAGATREAVGIKVYGDGRGRPFSATEHGLHSRAHQAREGYRPDGDPYPAEALHGTPMVATAPATPEAAAWSGWGTALKPSHEPVILARKPDDIEAITEELDRLWREQAADLTTRTGAADGSSDLTGMSPSGSGATTCSNIVSSWRECWAETCDLMSTSTIATTSSTTTDLKILRSCLAQITPANITPDPTWPSGLTSIASAADHLFAAVLLSLRATHALSVAATATGTTPTSRPDGDGNPIAHEPIVVARKPLVGTVAANVLEHGTGALNIDGCRVAAQGRPLIVSKAEGSTGVFGDGLNGSAHGGSTDQGRWPANVALDEAAAAELDAQSGERPGMARAILRRGATTGVGWGQNGIYGTAEPHEAVAGYGDTGGASRFFPVFRYEPKAPTAERPRVDGASHATVKPLDLMRWLVRLVTPPGGTVLDPFAGSGTTAEACVVEGFRCVAIELDPAHLPLIKARLAKPIQPVLFGDEEAS